MDACRTSLSKYGVVKKAVWNIIFLSVTVYHSTRWRGGYLAAYRYRSFLDWLAVVITNRTVSRKERVDDVTKLFAHGDIIQALGGRAEGRRFDIHHTTSVASVVIFHTIRHSLIHRAFILLLLTYVVMKGACFFYMV